MTIRDNINQYLSTKTHKRFIELGGIDYIIKRWEQTCDEIPYGTKYYMIDEHLNDLRFRYLIDEIVKHFELPKELSIRLNQADNDFVRKSTGINRCVLSAREEKGKDLTRERNWYYYCLPTSRVDEWLSMLS